MVGREVYYFVSMVRAAEIHSTPKGLRRASLPNGFAFLCTKVDVAAETAPSTPLYVRYPTLHGVAGAENISLEDAAIAREDVSRAGQGMSPAG